MRPGSQARGQPAAHRPSPPDAPAWNPIRRLRPAPAVSRRAGPSPISPLEGEMSGRTEGGRGASAGDGAGVPPPLRGAAALPNSRCHPPAATTEDPPLSAAPTSPPQGVRLEGGAAARNPIRRLRTAPAASRRAGPSPISPLEGEMSGRTEGGRGASAGDGAGVPPPLRGAAALPNSRCHPPAATAKDPPLSAAPTSPPQGGRLETADAAC